MLCKRKTKKAENESLFFKYDKLFTVFFFSYYNLFGYDKNRLSFLKLVHSSLRYTFRNFFHEILT